MFRSVSIEEFQANAKRDDVFVSCNRYQNNRNWLFQARNRIKVRKIDKQNVHEYMKKFKRSVIFNQIKGII